MLNQIATPYLAISATIWESLIPALIAAGVALAGAFISVRAGRRTTLLAAQLQQQQADRDARRDYEYEARKRLYQQCEPILFQARELAEVARRRIISIARSCRSNDLRDDGTGWLADHNYYFKSTVYYLLAPMTMFQLLRNRLTSADLSLDPTLHVQYELLKAIYLSLTTEFALANTKPALDYDPDKADPDQPNCNDLLITSPQTYRRQGLYVGTQEIVLEALTTGDKGQSDSLVRLKTFGEFTVELDTVGSPLQLVLPAFDELFKGSHPHICPVLWRVLVSQFLLYEALIQCSSTKGKGGLGLLNDRVLSIFKLPPSHEEIKELDWRTSVDAHVGDADISSPLVAARLYLVEQLTAVGRRFEATPGRSDVAKPVHDDAHE
jgi:hypothetical protein